MLFPRAHKKTKKTVYESIQENIKYGLSVSSISGVSHISYEDGRTKVERLLWILVIILMVCLAVSQGSSVLTRYNERPVIVTVDKSSFKWNLVFPTATVCCRDLRKESELTMIIKNLVTKFNLSQDILTTEKEQFLEYLRDLAFKNYYNYQEYLVYASGEKKEYISTDQYMEVLDQVVWLLQIPTDRKESFSMSPVNLPFSKTRPVLRIFTEFGPCMVINPDVSIHFTPGYFNLSTPYDGYKAIYYTKNVMASMSVKIDVPADTDVYFHESNEVMDILDRRSSVRGFYFKQSKYDTEMVTLHKNVKSLSVQQKKCRLPYEAREQPLRHSPVYSHKLCDIECRIKISMKYCHCTPYYYRRLEGEPICNMTGMYCLSKYKDMLLKTDDTNLCSFCPQNCVFSIFRESEVVQEYNFAIGPGTFEMFLVFPEKIYVRNLIFSLLDLIGNNRPFPYISATLYNEQTIFLLAAIVNPTHGAPDDQMSGLKAVAWKKGLNVPLHHPRSNHFTLLNHFHSTLYIKIFYAWFFHVQIGGIFSLFLGCSLLSFIEMGYFLTLRMYFGLRSRNEE